MTARMQVRVPRRRPLAGAWVASAALVAWAAAAPGRASAQTHAVESVVNVARASASDATGIPLTATSRVETPVELLAEIELSPGSEASVRPGETLDLRHTLTNRGNYPESFELSAVGSRGWPLELLLAGASGASTGVRPATAGFGVRSGSQVAAPRGAPPAAAPALRVGPLAPGVSIRLVVRVRCPPSTTPDDVETTTLAACAARVPQEMAAVQDRVRAVLSTLDPLRLHVDPVGVVPPGAVLSYRLEIGNPDPERALADVVLEDVLDPAFVELLQVTSGELQDESVPGRRVGVQAGFDPATRRLLWRLDPLPPGFHATLVLAARVGADVPPGTRIANRVTACAPALGALLSNEVVTPVAPPFLELHLLARTPVVAPGDAVLYTVEILNRSTDLPLDDVRVDVHLPAGFCFLKGGAGDPPLAVPRLEPGARWRWTVACGASPGVARGSHVATASARATALGDLVLETAAQAPVEIAGQVGLEGTILGRVYVDDDSTRTPGEFEGLPNVRVLLEDGTQSTTDARGRFHLEGVRAGLHVLRLDTSGLPHRLRFDTEGRLAAGSDRTRFLDLEPGEMQKLNFRGSWASGPPPARYEIATRCESWRFYGFSLFEAESGALLPQAERVLRGLLAGAPTGDSLLSRLAASAGGASGGTSADTSRVAVSVLPTDGAASDTLATARLATLERALGLGVAHEDAAPPHPELPLEQRVGTMSPEPAILAPADSALATGDRTDVLVKLPLGTRARLLLNGDEVSAALVGMRLEAPARGLACLRYIGLPLRPGENRIVLEARSDSLTGGGDSLLAADWLLAADSFLAARSLLGKAEILIARAGPPARIEILPESAVADGSTAPRLLLRVLDKGGRPSVEALFATVDAEGGVLGDDADPGRDGFQVRLHDGCAAIELPPVTSAGERRVAVRCEDIGSETRLRLRTAPRDWLVTGLGELSVGVRPDAAPFATGDTRDGFAAHGGLYAQGRVLGDGQLTLAVDTDRQRDALFGTLEDDRLFPVLGDAAASVPVAPSTWPMFARLDVPAGHVQVGDFRPGWNDNELVRFDRALTGLDGAWSAPRGEARVEGFAAAAHQGGARDDIPGRGIAGPYVLRRRPVRVHSERLSIETRDRFHSERVLAVRVLERHADYTIDFENGIVYLKEPLAGADTDWNPLVLVALYDTDSETAAEPLVGLRGSASPLPGLRGGFVAVREEGSLGARTLLGGDAAWALRRDLVLACEYARSEAAESDAALGLSLQGRLGGDRTGRVYYREIGARFENPSGPAPGEIGTRKYGLDARLRLGAASRLVVDASVQEDLRRASLRQALVLDYVREWRGWTGTLGYRLTGAREAASTSLANVLGLRARRQLGSRLGVEAGYQQTLGKPLEAYPTRLALGADVGLTSSIGLRLRQEWDGSDTGRRATLLGIESRLSERTAVTSSYEQLVGPGGDRGSARVGIRTDVPLGGGWSLRGSAELGRALVAPAGGSSALSLGASWRRPWSVASLEYELLADGALQQHAVRAGGSMRVGRDWMLLGRERWLCERTGAETRVGHDLLLGWAYRPVGDDVLQWLASVRLLANVAPLASPGLATSRLVASLQGSLELAPRWTLLAGLASRRSLAAADGARAETMTWFAHARAIWEFAPRFDLAAGLRHRSASGAAADWSCGLESGYRLAKDLWMVAGWNFTGFAAGDFPAQEPTASRGHVSLRVKFDERTLGLDPAQD